jgi:hypothetical protein
VAHCREALPSRSPGLNIDAPAFDVGCRPTPVKFFSNLYLKYWIKRPEAG